MGELSVSTLSLFLTFVTPALPLFVLYRIFLPKTRTIFSGELALVLTCCCASVLINGALIAQTLSEGTAALIAQGHISGSSAAISGLIFGSPPERWFFRPALWWVKYLYRESPAPADVCLLIFDFHLRTFFIGLMILLFARLPGRLEQHAQTLPYKKGFPNLNLFDTVLCKLVKISLDKKDHNELYEKNRIQFRWLNWFRDALYHPWARITMTNKYREILMVDLLTDEGSLYSGCLSTWAPRGSHVSSISMEYIIRYLPKSEQNHRKKLLVKNNGELTIPAEQIITAHFWEIRKNYQTLVVIKSIHDADVLKWNLLLAYIHPEFFKKIWVHIFLTEKDLDYLGKEVQQWIEDSRIELPFDQLVAILVSEKTP